MIDKNLTGEAPEHYLSQIVHTDQISSKGLVGRVEANDQERAAIADALDLATLRSLTFSFRLHPAGKNKYALNGVLEASLAQRCVVTLEPLEVTLDEDIELEFIPSDELTRLETDAGDETASVLFDGPEPISNGLIDVGELAYELLASSLDPYPRKAGASFDWAGSDVAEEAARTESPFAVLKQIDRRKN